MRCYWKHRSCCSPWCTSDPCIRDVQCQKIPSEFWQLSQKLPTHKEVWYVPTQDRGRLLEIPCNTITCT